MDTENLTVSWDHLRNNLSYKEYVVQYKQAGSPPGKGHDWARVNKSRTMEVFKGLYDFDNFIAMLKVFRNVTIIQIFQDCLKECPEQPVHHYLKSLWKDNNCKLNCELFDSHLKMFYLEGVWFVLDALKLGCVSPPTGQFEKCTPYQVSLFIVSHNQSHPHSSVIAYSVQGSKYVAFWHCVRKSVFKRCL